jgi:hypothetical protein
MRYQKFIVNNRKRISKWIDSKEEFILKRLRPVKKTIRKRANSYIKFLQQIGWVKKKQEELTITETVTIDKEKLYTEIIKLSSHLHREYNFCTSRKFTILMGIEHFNALMGSNLMIYQPLVIKQLEQYNIHTPNILLGMLLVVLPWMEGVLLVPEEYLLLGRQP